MVSGNNASKQQVAEQHIMQLDWKKIADYL